MSDNGIQQVSPSTTALNAERYQTFEMAKANDDVIGGEDLTQLRSYSAASRAQAQAVHKTIAMMHTFNGVAAAKAEATESSQAWAKVSVYADERMGEIISSLPTKQGARTDATLSSAQDEVTKTEAIREAGITRSQAYDLVKMAANPEVVEAVIAKAESEGRIVSRSQVLKAIKERDAANKALSDAQSDLEESYRASELLESQIESLKRQVAEKPKPEVIEREVVREVVPDDYEDMKRQVSRLKHDTEIYVGTNRKLRRQLDDAQQELGKARDVLGMDKTMQDVRRDVQYLTSATINYVRRYGGLTWTVQQLGEIDDESLDNLRNSVKNLATFSVALTEALDGEYGKRHS